MIESTRAPVWERVFEPDHAELVAAVLDLVTDGLENEVASFGRSISKVHDGIEYRDQESAVRDGRQLLAACLIAAEAVPKRHGITVRCHSVVGVLERPFEVGLVRRWDDGTNRRLYVEPTVTSTHESDTWMVEVEGDRVRVIKPAPTPP